jgi:type I restriction enzyme R subunit
LLENVAVSQRRRRRSKRYRITRRGRAGRLLSSIPGQVQAGQAEDTPKTLNTPGRRALYNNLNQNEPLALQIDAAVKRVRPADWRGHQARENQIKREALLPLLGNSVAEVERIFLIIKQQAEY